MRALVYRGPRQMVMEDWPRRHPTAGQVEIAVEATGICGADIAGFLGRSRRRTPPMIFGHELVGRTPEGRRVVVDPLLSCGVCGECLRGQRNLCANLRLLGMDDVIGCFAEYVAVCEQQVYEIPERIADAQAVLAEPLANVVHLLRLANPQPGFRVGVIGAGQMGAMALQLALRLGASEVLVEDVDDLRLVAASKMGATHAVNAVNGRDAASDFAGHGLDIVVDACGAAEGRQEALDLCRPGGTVVMFGLASARSEIDFRASILKQIHILTSFGYTPEDFTRSLELLAAGEIDLTTWIEERPLEDGQQAFQRMTDCPGDTLKMVLRVR